MEHSTGGGKWMQTGLALACGAMLCLPCAAWGQTAAAQQKPAPAQSGSNPFPEDTKDVPVMPSTPGALANAESDAGEAPPVVADLPANDLDPVRSPDDGNAGDDTDTATGFSSSRSGADSLLPDPNAPPSKQKGRRGWHENAPAQEHKETAEEDLSVGKYYLDNKNWRAAQSRYQSALVLAPENPDVYWGLAESARHLGDAKSARANYEKVIEYDPDSKRAKEAAKALKSSDLAAKQ